MQKSFGVAAVVGLTALAAAHGARAQPFESVLTHPVVTIPALDNRAVATIRVNPSASRAYATAGGPPTPGSPGFLHVTIWSDKGGVQIFQAYDMPGTSGSFDVRSISEDANGNFYVAGYCSNATLVPRTFVAKFNSNLAFTWCLVWSGADTTDPRVRALALSSGNVVVIEPVNTGVTNRPQTRITCLSPSASVLWQNEYTTATCEAIRLADLFEEPGGWVYAVGRMHPTGLPSLFHNACVLAIDPDPVIAQGQAVGLWTNQSSLGFGGEYLGADIGPGGELYAAGTLTFFAAPGPGFVTQTRISRLDAFSGMAVRTDALYSNAPMLPAIGAASYVPFTNGSSWASPPVFAVAGNGAGPAGTLLRVDAFGLSFSTGTTFGGGSPVETVFHDLALDRLQAANVLLAGERIPVTAGTEEAYLVRTGPFGASACSTPWSATPTFMTTTTTAHSAVTLNGTVFCDGTPLGFVTAFSQITLPPHVFSVTVTVKKKCDAAICSGDLNQDALVDDSDFATFAPQYDLLLCADAMMPAGCPSDFNLDGFVDDDDFRIFVGAYNALICE